MLGKPDKVKKVRKLESEEIECKVCGDNGSVPAMYVDSSLGMHEGQRPVPCPKCHPQKKDPNQMELV